MIIFLKLLSFIVLCSLLLYHIIQRCFETSCWFCRLTQKTKAQQPLCIDWNKPLLF